MWQFMKKTMGYPINEIFYTLQGEGFYSGRPAVFVRFSGCNLKCPFCDTDFRKKTNMTAEEIMKQVDMYNSHFVVLTGGEPSLYVDRTLINLLHDHGREVAIETNGTHALKGRVDWVSVSPKGDYCDKADVVLAKCNEVKVVFTGHDVSQYLDIQAEHYYIQPCDLHDAMRNKETLKQAIEYCKKHPQWSLSLQTQKLLGIK